MAYEAHRIYHTSILLYIYIGISAACVCVCSRPSLRPRHKILRATRSQIDRYLEWQSGAQRNVREGSPSRGFRYVSAVGVVRIR